MAVYWLDAPNIVIVSFRTGKVKLSDKVDTGNGIVPSSRQRT